jgi:exodeoxyribonuclease VII large subunit
VAILTVSQLNKYVSYYLKENNKLSGIFIKGEVSNLKKHYSSGHYYFSLKDDTCSIRVCMFSSNVKKMKFQLEDGMFVIAYGNVALYEKDGSFQMYVTDIQLSGVGNEYILLNQLKNKLEQKGYFLSERKKSIYRYPTSIAVVTSNEGAAIRDIVNIITRRYPLCTLYIVGTLVQGDSSVKNICQSLLIADTLECDTVILTRGGGSSDDLSVFNSEQICDVIYNMKTPLISAIGHETDYTLSDYVADLRVPTPSAAAELCSISVEQIKEYLAFISNKMQNSILNKIKVISDKVNGYEQILNVCHNNVNNSMIKNRLTNLNSRIDHGIYFKIRSLEIRLDTLKNKIENCNPNKLMSRGYYFVYKNGEIVYDLKLLSKDDILEIVSSDGKVKVKVI